jgi:DNA polymerase III subunit gamma/tau
MAYTVLARKYRPHNFSELVGQEHVVQALSNALQSQRLHHAYLFTGTRGVGKTTVSRILAKSLNCVGVDGQGDITDQPCGVCQACVDIDQGRFVDYTELDAASNRGVDEVQSLLEQAVYKPVQGRFKVFMIDEVHMLTNTAFNAMLKTLEEPPEYLKFVLATTDPQKVPVTVLSRCLQFNLRPMPAQTVVDHLQTVLAHEHVPFEMGALRFIGKSAHGSMRDALSLTDQAIAFGNGAVNEEPVRHMLGAVDAGHVFDLILALSENRGADVVAMIDAARVQGLSAAATLEDMAGALQRMAVLQMTGKGDEADPDYAQLKALAVAMPADETQLLYSLCLHGRGDLGLAPDEYAALTMILLRLLAFKPGAVQASAEKKSLNNVKLGRVAASGNAGSAVSGGGVSGGVGGGVSAVVPATKSADGLHVSNTSHARSAADAPNVSNVSNVSKVSNTPASFDAPTDVVNPVVHADGFMGPAGVDTLTPERALQAALAQDRPHTGAAAQASSPPLDQQLGYHQQGQEQEQEQTQSQTQSPIQTMPVPTTRMPVRQASVEYPSQATPVLRAAPDSSAAESGLVCTPEGDLWLATVQALIAQERIGALVRELALQSQLVATDESRAPVHWLLRIERESLNQGANRERLQQALADAGHAVQLGVELGVVHDTPAKRLAAQAAQALREAEHIILNDPFAQQMMQEFGAVIVPGSLKAVAADSHPDGASTSAGQAPSE